jgi:hypothetical protein
MVVYAGDRFGLAADGELNAADEFELPLGYVGHRAQSQPGEELQTQCRGRVAVPLEDEHVVVDDPLSGDGRGWVPNVPRR